MWPCYLGFGQFAHLLVAASGFIENPSMWNVETSLLDVSLSVLSCREPSILKLHTWVKIIMDPVYLSRYTGRVFVCGKIRAVLGS